MQFYSESLKNAFRTLGVEVDTPLSEVKKAYRALIKKYHPDRYANDPAMRKKAEEKTIAINTAMDEINAYYQDPNNSKYKSTYNYSQQSYGNRSSSTGYSGYSRPQSKRTDKTYNYQTYNYKYTRQRRSPDDIFSTDGKDIFLNPYFSLFVGLVQIFGYIAGLLAKGIKKILPISDSMANFLALFLLSLIILILFCL